MDASSSETVKGTGGGIQDILGKTTSTRTPFVPVRRQPVSSSSCSSPVYNNNNNNNNEKQQQHPNGTTASQVKHLVSKMEGGNGGHCTPLTTSNLSRYTAALSIGDDDDEGVVDGDEQVINVRSLGHGLPSTAALLSRRLGQTATTSSGPSAVTLAPPSPSPSSTSTSTTIPRHGGGVTVTPSTSMLTSTKRYTRQMAPSSPPNKSSNNNSSNNNTVTSSNELRVKARITSGSAPRRKPTVPGTERADRPPSSIYSSYSRPETPSSSSSSAILITSNNARPRSFTGSRLAHTPAAISRPPSRNGDSANTSSEQHIPSVQRSISRPQSRMDDFPSHSIISAGSSVMISPNIGNGFNRQRSGSDSSVGTVVHRRKENVIVCVRVRPPLAPNASTVEEAWVSTDSNQSIALADGTGHKYTFDALVTGSGNEKIYSDAAKGLVQSSMNGFDAVIFAYGQTASGKTFTLSGTSDNPGIIPQAVSDIFQYIRSHPKREFLLRASYLEIYNEQLKDLLSPETAGQVKVRQDERKRFFVSPLREEVVTSEAHVAQLMKRGETNRHTGSTDYNARSSRSHAVFQMVIESRDISGQQDSRQQDSRQESRPSTPAQFSKKAGGCDDQRAVVTSRLSLIDLAGSERATSQAERRVEGAFINRSLLTLEKVIAALTEEKTRAHVPYRDSKLTQILQPSLSGEARVAVICTINPSISSVQESVSTLKFAQRVKKVTLNAERNEIVGEKALLIRYEQTIAEMTAYIAQLENAQGGLPQTPRPGDMTDSRLELPSVAPTSRVVSNPDVLKAKEDRAKLQGFIVNAGNLDVKRDDGPRPVTPLKAVPAAQLPMIQEQLLDSQDRVAELEEICEKQQDEIRSLRVTAASLSANSSDSAEPENQIGITAMRQRIEELEQQCREYRTILANEDRTAALRSERRMAAREWSDKLVTLQESLDRSRAVQLEAVRLLDEERKRTVRLEKLLLKSGIQFGDSKHRQAETYDDLSNEGLDLLSCESPMLDTHGSYINLDEILTS